MNKLAVRGASALSGMIGGAVASLIFKQVWKLAAGEDEAPQATSPDYGWGEVVVAAAVQGAIFAAVKAAIDRAGAEAYRRSTGEWVTD
ncbi:DUF4235 domain-containing protein [Herbidospora yilanensis]|uniref:DUF4235 domain-containing protein n=1 Tax=Herbidospora yilanensis TaxID=354426 RepID=UPI000784B95A|nr:DUF4235 domain-containing protein [Herbidospora yilanensis]